MAGSLQGKIALVTGASSGIGRASAVAMAREGAKVVVSCDKNVEGGKETVRLIKKAGGEAIFVKTDVSKIVDVEALVNTAIKTYGRLDCALNNAGIGQESVPLAQITEEIWDRVLDINLKGIWLCMKYEIEQMEKQGSGAIVNVSSLGGVRAVPLKSAYVASKHGVVGLTKAGAVEYAKKNIRVNAICPGLVDTEIVSSTLSEKEKDVLLTFFQPIGRLGEPKEVAEAAVWLLSDAASFVTGLIMNVDGGSTAQ